MIRINQLIKLQRYQQAIHLGIQILVLSSASTNTHIRYNDLDEFNDILSLLIQTFHSSNFDRQFDQFILTIFSIQQENRHKISIKSVHDMYVYSLIILMVIIMSIINDTIQYNIISQTLTLN